VTLAGKETYMNPLSYISFTRDTINLAFSQQFLRFKQFVSQNGLPIIIDKRKQRRAVCHASSKNGWSRKNKNSKKMSALLALFSE
jgi:hypothetical protein